MRKTILYILMFLITTTLVFAASVSRTLPNRADPNTELAVRLQISGADTTGIIALEEELPTSVTIKDWSITGAKETKAQINTRQKDNKFGWEFTPTGSSATVEYKINLGSSDITFGTLVFFDKSGQSKVDPQTLSVREVTCGDGICEEAENSDNCEADCPKPAPPVPRPEPTPKTDEGVKGASFGWVILLVVVIIGVIIYFTLIKKRK